jgi:predicted porin
MKKSLLAVAVAAALPTLVQAQSSVTLFGRLDAALEYSNENANGSAAGKGEAGLRLADGRLTQSRVGIRGVEDLGGGLRAIFHIEHRLDISTGDTAGGNIFLLPGGTNATTNNKFWNALAFVGLEGGWGRLMLGRNYTPIFYALQPNDYTGYTFYNNFAAFIGTGAGLANSVQGPIRLDNAISYRSPTFGGLTLHAVYAPGENLTNSATTGSGVVGTGDVWGIAAGWQLGGLYAMAGYHSFDQKAVAVVQPLGLESVMVASVGYRTANWGASIGYSVIDGIATAGSPEIKTLFGSGFLNIGPGALHLSVAQNDVSGFSGLRNDSGLQLGLAYNVPLSKRTSWYLAWGQNDFSPLQSTAATTYLLDSQTRVALGIHHQF